MNASLLQSVHVLAFLVHVVNGALGTHFLQRDGWFSVELFLSSYAFGSATAPTCRITVPGASDRQVCTGAFFSTEWVLVAIEFVTAAFHVYYFLSRYWEPSDRPVRNPARFFEWAITATALSLGNLVSLGFRDMTGIAFATVLLVAVQVSGFLFERLTRLGGDAFVANSLFAIACLFQGSFFATVIVTVTNLQNGQSPRADGRRYGGFSEQAGAYIAQYLVFGVLSGVAWYRDRGRRDLMYELLYAVLGVTTKTSIFWMIFAAIRSSQRYYGFLTTSTDWEAVRVSFAYAPFCLFLLAWVAASFTYRAPQPPPRQQTLRIPPFSTGSLPLRPVMTRRAARLSH